MNGPGLLVSSDVVERTLRTPGSNTPAGLFNPLPMTERPGALPPLAPDMTALVDALRRMLRDITSVNVRQPSTLAPPFRALNWYSRQGFAFSATGPITGTISFNGNQTVPQGVNAVITHVRFQVALDPNSNTLTDPLDIANAFLAPSFMSLLVDGVVVPGFSRRIAEVVQLTTAIGLNEVIVGLNHLMMPLAAPIALQAGSVVTFEADTNPAFVLLLAGLVEATGYLYPIEMSADGVRGTLADRGSE